jgi:hypothetical protein
MNKQQNIKKLRDELFDVQIKLRAVKRPSEEQQRLFEQSRSLNLAIARLVMEN